MSNSLYSELAWLPRQADEFYARCRGLLDSPQGFADRARTLASCALDENALHRLAKTMREAIGRDIPLQPLTPFRLGLISNATSSFIVPALIGTAVRHGIALSCVESEFDQMMQQALSPQSEINSSQLDAVLVALDHHGLPLQATPGDRDAAAATVAACLSHLDAIRDGLHRHGRTVCILQSIARPTDSLFGSFDSVLPGTIQNLIEQINHGVSERVAAGTDVLLDVAGIAQTVGLADWHDPTLWNMAKLPFRSEMLPLYADHVCRLIAAMRGKSRRCLVMDLDNTLWGGVIGDDGLSGIALAQGDATGEAHLSVQRAALALRQRGVVLAVSSKNDDATARLAFREHPDMLLKEEHISVFQANWRDKATNLKAIAAELSLGLESLVFLDDNPVERDLVRQMLPQVAVPELPLDPALYARTLAAAGYFESISFSVEDRARAHYYQDNARRVALAERAGDLDSYLQSLQMQISFQPFDETGRVRITQLISKSNQFNLTTRRYSEAQVSQMERDSGCFTLQVRLADKFGDNGMISVVICRQQERDWLIDTWLMSCRVLGRNVERAVLQELAYHAPSHGVSRLVGMYCPTPRNALVVNHYENLGFQLQERRADGTTLWTLELAQLPASTLQMTVRRGDFGGAVQPGHG